MVKEALKGCWNTIFTLFPQISIKEHMELVFWNCFYQPINTLITFSILLLSSYIKTRELDKLIANTL